MQNNFWCEALLGLDRPRLKDSNSYLGPWGTKTGAERRGLQAGPDWAPSDPLPPGCGGPPAQGLGVGGKRTCQGPLPTAQPRWGAPRGGPPSPRAGGSGPATPKPQSGPACNPRRSAPDLVPQGPKYEFESLRRGLSNPKRASPKKLLRPGNGRRGPKRAWFFHFSPRRGDPCRAALAQTYWFHHTHHVSNWVTLQRMNIRLNPSPRVRKTSFFQYQKKRIFCARNHEETWIHPLQISPIAHTM